MSNLTESFVTTSVFSQSVTEDNSVYNELLEEFRRRLHKRSEGETVALVTLYVPVFLMAFCGNILILIVVLPKRHMRNMTNIFIVNLATADLTGNFLFFIVEKKTGLTPAFSVKRGVNTPGPCDVKKGTQIIQWASIPFFCTDYFSTWLPQKIKNKKGSLKHRRMTNLLLMLLWRLRWEVMSCLWPNKNMCTVCACSCKNYQMTEPKFFVEMDELFALACCSPPPFWHQTQIRQFFEESLILRCQKVSC